MKTLILVGALTVLACGEDPALVPFPPPPPADATLVGIFEGKFPCADCEKIKTGLVLYQDRAGAPTVYDLREIGVGRTDTPLDSHGSWKTTRGARAFPEATVYQLQPAGGDGPVSYLRADDNILLLLDGDLNLRVGNAAYSFTLSRTR